MKKALLIPVLALALTACKDNSRTDSFSSIALAAEKVALQKNSESDLTTAKEARSTSSGTKPSTVYREKVVYSNTSSHAAKTPVKKGMSKSAKYAIIGGAGGAVVGGVATKSTKGAVIGGVVGAGAGYLFGRKKDKESGRVQ